MNCPLSEACFRPLPEGAAALGSPRRDKGQGPQLLSALPLMPVGVCFAGEPAPSQRPPSPDPLCGGRGHSLRSQNDQRPRAVLEARNPGTETSVNEGPEAETRGWVGALPSAPWRLSLSPSRLSCPTHPSLSRSPSLYSRASCPPDGGGGRRAVTYGPLFCLWASRAKVLLSPVLIPEGHIFSCVPRGI